MNTPPLVMVKDIPTHFPWWPYSSDGTYRLIRLGQLRSVSVGRRRYVNESLLRAFIEAHTK